MVACFSVICQPRGRTSSVATLSFSWYFLPSGLSQVMVRSRASRRLIWPSILLCQVGELASSKSAMKTLAPLLSALITILRSTGPVISTRRSCKSPGMGATFQSAARMAAVSARKSGNLPASISFCRARRNSRRSPRRASKRKHSAATKFRAAGVRIPACPPTTGA